MSGSEEVSTADFIASRVFLACLGGGVFLLGVLFICIGATVMGEAFGPWTP